MIPITPLGSFGEPDYSKALYTDPSSHDFLCWLLQAEMVRRYHGAAHPLRVKLLLRDGQLGKPEGCSRDYSDAMIPNVLMPAMDMLGVIKEPDISSESATVEELMGYVQYDHHMAQMTDAAKAGFEVPRFDAPQWARDEVRDFLGGHKPVIITLRETLMQPERNSNTFEWLRFASSIANEYPILFIRDTHMAEKPLGPFRTWARASRNAYVRAALYDEAHVNLMTSSGPSAWPIWSARHPPYIIFKQLIPELPYWQHGQPEGWREQDHLEVGDQYAWAVPGKQILTWTDDTFENIAAAFAEFVAGNGKPEPPRCEILVMKEKLEQMQVKAA